MDRFFARAHPILRAMGLISLLGLAGSALPACSNRPSEEQCSKLVSHIIELEFQAAGTSKLPEDMKASVEKQKKDVEEYLGQQAIDRCKESLPLAVVECGLAAKTLDERAACDQK